MIKASSEGLGKIILASLNELGAFTLFIRRILHTLVHTRGNGRAIWDQIAFITFRSLVTVVFSGVFVGAILVLQFNLMLVQYDAQSILGGLNTSALVREVAPLIISFLLAGKIGAFTAAELGTMRVTEQIDAVECLGTDPVQYLILPRFLGIIASGILLLMIGLLVSAAGSMAVAAVFSGINPLQYATSVPRFVTWSTVLAGVFMSAIYSTIVAGVSCFKGFTASGGAKGVGRAVAESAIFTNFYIVLANYIAGGFLDWMDGLWRSVFERFGG